MTFIENRKDFFMIVEVKELTRTFSSLGKSQKSVEALKGISFSIEEGEIFGLLGPNGAGKSTMIKILTTMLLPTSGVVKVMGLDVSTEEKEIRKKINFVFGGERSLYWRLSARDNLAYFADIYRIPKKEQNNLIEHSLVSVGLLDVQNQRVETFSKGMKQRLQIARSLLNKPKIIFLDEPSIGLDPVGARDLRILIRKLAQQGTTVLLTTHYMPEAEELCDRIAVINKGERIAYGTLSEISDSLSDNEKKRILLEKQQLSRKSVVSLEDIYLKLVEDI